MDKFSRLLKEVDYRPLLMTTGLRVDFGSPVIKETSLHRHSPEKNSLSNQLFIKKITQNLFDTFFCL